MYYIHKKGSNNRLLVLFHGTGGDAKEMIGLGQQLDSEASLLAIEGDVKQWRMNRYFIRHDDGSFDLDNLRDQTKKVYDLTLELIKAYGHEQKEMTLVGYSNGANLIQNMLKTYSTNFKYAIMFHPSLVRGDVDFLPQKETMVFVTSGDNDPYITLGEFNEIVMALKKQDIAVKTLHHQYGHALTPQELDKAIKIIRHK